jgi:ComF family protein
MNQMTLSIKAMPRRILDTVLPPRCPICRSLISEQGHLCSSCWLALDVISEARCGQCALPFLVETESGLCEACIQSPPAFDGASAPVLYQGAGRDLVLALKHSKQFAAVPAMARMMANDLVRGKVGLPTMDAIMPVPLHWKRRFYRRFNQSQLLAVALSKATGLPFDNFSLIKKKSTPSQGEFGKKGRFDNVKSAFEVPDRFAATVAGKKIILVDDVLTTGATASACAHALKKAGAEYVHVAVFARVGKTIAA